MSTYAIGDIHGRADLLRGLLSKLPVTADDEVVFLGDYIDRGPDSKGTIDLLLEFSRESDANVSFLMGNHEQWLLKTLDNPRRHSWLLGMNGITTIRSYSTKAAATIETALASLGPALIVDKPLLPYECFKNAIPTEHLTFLASLAPYLRTRDVVCVHAGVSPKYCSVENESVSTLVWGEQDWWLHYDGPDQIVYGHWNNACRANGKIAPFVYHNTFGIDGSDSGVLLAIRFPDLETWCSH